MARGSRTALTAEIVCPDFLPITLGFDLAVVGEVGFEVLPQFESRIRILHLGNAKNSLTN